MSRTLLVCSAMVSLGLLGATAIVTGGPLDPPAGAVAPTYKTLTEVEPRTAINATNTPGDADSVFRITQPGAYYLTGNVTGVLGKMGIEVVVSQVTVDLNGFTLQGVSGSLDGLRADSGVDNVSVLNGQVVGWGGDGVNVEFSTLVTNDHGMIRGVHASQNGARGIRAGTNSLIIECTASGNSGDGFFSGNNSVVENCNSSNNGNNGYASGNACVLRGCLAYRNTGHGFQLSSANLLESCLSVLNSGHGFSTSPSFTVTFNRCHAQANVNNGFTFGEAVVLECTAKLNGDVGFLASAGGSRIEGCTAIENTIGFSALASGNLIIRNAARGNTTANYDLVANNRVGQVVVPPATPAVLGSTGAPGGLSTTDPWANLSF